MKKLIFIGLLIAGLASGCRYNNVYINREEDNNDGKKIVKEIYDNVASGNFNELDVLTSDSLKRLVGQNGVSKLAHYINKKVGKFKSYDINDFYIRSVVGSNNIISYNYKLKVVYEKGVIDEVIGLVKIADSPIRISAYRANSDLLIK